MGEYNIVLTKDQLRYLENGGVINIPTNIYVGHLSSITIQLNKDKPKEMTIEEIEKALGHKVKIVGEKEIEKACSNCRHLNQLTGGCRLACKDLEKFEARED